MKKVRKSFRLFVWLCIFFTIVLIVVNTVIVKPHIYYPGFEIYLPAEYIIHGIDVSRYQGIIDWSSVKGMESKGIKIGFVFIKATEGIKLTDRQFKRNWKGAQSSGIPRGAYHYFIPGRDPAKQAANFIRHVTLDPQDLPPVLDIEINRNSAKEKLKQEVRQWLDLVESHYNVTPIIYTNISFYEAYFSEGFEKYPVWIAHYLQAEKPRTDRQWSFWQHNEQGHVDGIKGLVDFNVFNGDSTAFRKLLLPGQQ